MSNLISVLQNNNDVKVIDATIEKSSYIEIDLSTTNKKLEKFELSTATSFENFISKYLTEHQATVAFGGYNEIRNLYKRSAVFKNDVSVERNIHIGLDLWIAAETDVLAALDGKVHSFQNNTSFGDYGPTIILEHEIENVKFYTLYGHLSEESLVNLYVGKSFSKADKLATLGNYPINGDYAPHLHFQIIEDIGTYLGDYPGVCSSATLAYYLANCPNSNYLLKL